MAEWTVGIIGCGRIAGARDCPRRDGPVATHAQAYFRHPSFKVVAAMNPTHDHLASFQQRWQIPRGYATLEEFLAGERLDVISLCSPNTVHGAQATAILASPNRPKVLFMEKPVCPIPEELETLKALAERTKTTVLVNHTRRFDPGHRRVADLIRAGTFGPLVEGRYTYYGGWLNNGAHLVDTLRLLFPGQIDVTEAAFADHGRGADQNLRVNLRMQAVSVRLEAVDESYYQLFESELRFASGRVRFFDFGARILMERVEAQDRERVLVPISGSPLAGLQDPLWHAVQAIDEVLTGQPRIQQLGVDLSQAALTMRTVWQALDLAKDQAAQPLVMQDVAQQ